MPIQQFFNQLLVFMNLYEYAKNQAVLSFRSGHIADLQTLQFDWLRAFLYISKELDFPNYGIFGGKQQII